MSEQQTIKCAIVVGMREDGSVFVETHGSEQNLITLDGLLDYGKDYVDEQWAQKKAQAIQAQAQAQSEATAEVVEEAEVEVIPPVKEPAKRTRRKKPEVIDAQ